MRKIIFTLFGLFSFCLVGAQNLLPASQYFQNLPAYSPAFTGSQDYWDIAAGFRSQWTGYVGAPALTYASGYGVLQRKSDENKHNVKSQKFFPGESAKAGFGGFVVSNDIGPISHLEAMANFAVHIRFVGNKSLSLGTSMGITNSKVDVDELTSADPANDITYQNFINNAGQSTHLNMDASLGFYSPRFYVSYGISRLINNQLGGDDMEFNLAADARNNILLGTVSSLSPKIELFTNVFYRFDFSGSSLLDINTRAKYGEHVNFGFGFRSDNTLIGLLGFDVNEAFGLSYSYDYKTANVSDFNNSSHEIVLHLNLFRKGEDTNLW